MGYAQHWREKLLKAAVARHTRVLKKVEEGQTTLHRKLKRHSSPGDSKGWYDPLNGLGCGNKMISEKS